jgi:glyoxylase-like metal-dependent hydrolase (beta-lactamase superfamily II)/rhodanese-related sulfurtransferase
MAQHDSTPTLDVATLQTWLAEQKPVQVLDVRPLAQREEWIIPASLHVDAYDRLKAGDPDALAGMNLSPDIPVVTVCAAGRMSQVAAAQLQQKGFQVYSLEGGMKAWSSAWNVASLPVDEQTTVLQVRRTGKGCLSYLVGSGSQVLVIDPSVAVEAYITLAEEHGWRITAVLETHLHADHLSRARQLAKKTNARLLLPANPHLQFPYEAITSQTQLWVGKLPLHALATPGHTLESYCYLLADKVLFSGDTLFTNGVGRPDLKADEEASRQKALLLFQSLGTLLKLPASVVVLPGHTSEPVAFDGKPVTARLGDLTERLPWLSLPEEAFTQTILQRIPPTPPNYLRISELNRQGDLPGVDALDLEAGANRCAIS